MDRNFLFNIIKRSKNWCRQNMANAITLVRIVIAFLLFSIIIYDSQRLWQAFFLAALAGLTDKIDGAVAKRYGNKSTFGCFLDRIADKIFIYPSLIILTYHHFWRLKNLSALTLIFTGLLIAFVSAIEVLIFIAGCIGAARYLKGIPVNLETSPSGKKKTFCGFLIVIIWLFSLAVEKSSGFPLIRFSVFVIDLGLVLMAWWAYKSLEDYAERKKEKN